MADRFRVAEFELGARIDRTSQRAGIPQLGAAGPMGPRMLAAAFAASGREQSDTTCDVVARAWVPIGEIVPRVTLSRKTRVPSLLERSAWLPTEASYGLADGNIYVGNQTLQPEVAYKVEASFDLAISAVTFARPSFVARSSAGRSPRRCIRGSLRRRGLSSPRTSFHIISPRPQLVNERTVGDCLRIRFVSAFGDSL